MQIILRLLLHTGTFVWNMVVTFFSKLRLHIPCCELVWSIDDWVSVIETKSLIVSCENKLSFVDLLQGSMLSKVSSKPYFEHHN
jgi:hypothetical protein